MLGCFGRRKRVKPCVHIVIPDGGVSGRMMLQQALCYFGDIEPFLRENEEMSPAMRRHLLEIFDDHQNAQDLRLELAAVVDAGVHFVSATYYLAGDTPLIFSCWLLSISPILQQLLVKLLVECCHIQPAYDTS